MSRTVPMVNWWHIPTNATKVRQRNSRTSSSTPTSHHPRPNTFRNSSTTFTFASTWGPSCPLSSCPLHGSTMGSGLHFPYLLDSCLSHWRSFCGNATSTFITFQGAAREPHFLPILSFAGGYCAMARGTTRGSESFCPLYDRVIHLPLK